MAIKAPKIKANISENRMYITASGKIKRKTLDNIYTEVRFCVADLKPGFTVVTDLSECTVAELSGLPVFRKIVNYLIENKVGRVVRIVDEENVVLKQLLNYAAQVQGYQAELYSSMDEAKEALESPYDRLDLRITLYEQPIEYTINDEQYSGELNDLSASGCSVVVEEHLSIGDQINCRIPFAPHEGLLETFEIGGEIVWVKEGMFGVQFLEMDDDAKEQLWQRLVHESKCDLFNV